MSYHEDEQDKAEAAWHRKAEYEGIRCSVCNEVISYGDREQFFSTKMCSYHADKFQNDK